VPQAVNVSGGMETTTRPRGRSSGTSRANPLPPWGRRPARCECDGIPGRLDDARRVAARSIRAAPPARRRHAATADAPRGSGHPLLCTNKSSGAPKSRDWVVSVARIFSYRSADLYYIILFSIAFLRRRLCYFRC
jgi:hypothetical protein